MATKAAEQVSAYGDISSAPGRRSQIEVVKTVATQSSAAILAATNVQQAYDAIAGIVIGDRAVTSNRFGRATRVETTQGRILTLDTRIGGSSYTNGTYNNVALTGGTGTGATANIVVSGGAVTAVTLVNGGQRYDIGEILSATAATIGGTGSGFSIRVATTSGPINA
jgi:hypothetical protein